MKKTALALITASVMLVAAPYSSAQYFARQKLPVATTPPGVASCGPLVKGDWFFDYPVETGVMAYSIEEAQAACQVLARKAPGSCGWTNDPWHAASSLNKVMWSTSTRTRVYNDPSNTEGFVWAASCPLR